jgi:hypothetical protein
VGLDTEQRTVDWLSAYVLGVAFSVRDLARACAEILEVTSDPRELRMARARLGTAQATDRATHRRALDLLDRTLATLEEPTPSSNRPARTHP